MTPPYRAAIVGCGGISGVHARGFNIPGRCQVVAGADLNSDNLMATCDRFDIPARYLDYREMLTAEHPDIVAICTWTGSHAPITIDAVRARVKGILCEKPMAVSAEECDQMVDACRASGAFLGIGHSYRFQPTVRTARERIRAGELGGIRLMHVSMAGGLANSGSHMIDLARCLLDDPAPVWALGQAERRTDRYERGVPIEECLIGEIGFEGGVRLVVESDLAESPTWLTVVGEQGMLRLKSVEIQSLQDGEWQTLPESDGPSQHPGFLDWMEGGPEYPATGEHGRTTIECIGGLFESARQRRRVQFPLAERRYPLIRMVEEGLLPIEKPGAYDIRGSGPRWQEGS